MKILFLFLSSIAVAQTVVIPSLPVTIPTQKIPAQTITIVTSRNGGKATFTIPSQTLPALTISTVPVTAPIALGTITLNFSCSGPDLQHLACTAVKQ
jgi:hypothetical protein